MVAVIEAAQDERAGYVGPAPPSTEQTEPEMASLALNSIEGVASLLTVAGWLSIEVTGGVLSMVHSKTEGLESTLPARSLARISTWCAPSERPLKR